MEYFKRLKKEKKREKKERKSGSESSGRGTGVFGWFVNKSKITWPL